MILGLGVSATAMATAVGNDSTGRFHYTVIARVSVFIVGGAIDPLSDFFPLVTLSDTSIIFFSRDTVGMYWVGLEPPVVSCPF